MFASALRRLLGGAALLILINGLGFSYAHLARYIQQRQNPFGSRAEPPALGALYADYLGGLTRLDLGTLPVGTGVPVAAALGEALPASAGLLVLALTAATLIGVSLGLAAVAVDPPRVAPWLAPVTTLGLATPSFYLGTLAVAGSVWLVINGWQQTPLPVAGYGWDFHLVLPVLALGLRPAAQLAAVTASLLAAELRQQYIVTARSVGNTWRRIRWRHALRNLLAPVILTVAGSVRLAIGELVLVEWLFAWPGAGRLLAQTLLSPNLAAPGGFSGGGAYFLNPALLAALSTILGLVFLAADTLAITLARGVDARLRVVEIEGRLR